MGELWVAEVTYVIEIAYCMPLKYWQATIKCFEAHFGNDTVTPRLNPFSLNTCCLCRIVQFAIVKTN